MKKKILIVVANYYKKVSDGLLKNAEKTLAGTTKLNFIEVPGVFEIPIIITEPYPVQISDPVVSDYNGFNTSCYGASDGSIDINAYGGEGLGLSVNYTYEWTGFNSDGNIDLGGQSNMSDISNLPAGSYQLVVYDSRLCSYEANFEIESPPSIEFELLQPTDDSSVCFDISCFGENDGWIQANSVNPPADENLGFSYTWMFNDVELEQSAGNLSINNLASGYYQLYVEDNLTGCQNIFGPIFISEPSVLYSSIDNVFISDLNSDGIDNDYNGYSTSCIGALDGVIGVEIYGGSGTYNVSCLDSDGNPCLDSDGNEIVGSAHNFREIYTKKKQGCNHIVLSRIFKTTYKNKKSFYGVSKFNLIAKNYNFKFIALGGIRSNNLMLINLVNCSGIALLSEVKKKPVIIHRLF